MKKANVKNWIFTPAMPRAALAAILAIMALLSAFALWQTMSETDQVDRERAAVAINALLLNHVQRLEIYTAEQAYSDELATELYRDQKSSQTLRDQWLETSLGEEHDIGFAFAKNGTQFFAVSAGELSFSNFYQLNKNAITELTAQITETSDCVGGIVWTPDGPRILTVARVRPVSDGQLLRVAQNQPTYIALSKPLNEELIAHLGSSLGIGGIAIDRADGKRTNATTTPVSKQVGDQEIEIVWQPVRPGKQALVRSLPVILIALFGGAALVLLLSRLIGNLLSAALRDTLSHLPNRRSLELQIARNAGLQQFQILAMVDMDGFKRINDNYGTHIGDQAIKAIADLLIQISPDNATIARLGGDEFAILMSGDDGEAALLAMVKQFHQILASPLTVGNCPLHLSATSGLSAVLASNETIALDLIIQSERALSIAKTRHRGQILVYDAVLAQEFSDQARLALQIQKALDANLLDMHFQPLFSARDGTITAVEALLRWKAEAQISAGPEQVIAAAENHGLGMQLAQAVLLDSCQKAAYWPALKIAVNVTPSQLLDPNLPHHVADVLQSCTMDTCQLELEVTESIAIADEAVFSQQFAKLRAMGIALALDDFGSGYASIGFLRRFPFQKLKIDKSLVDDAVANASGREMLVACVSAARAMGIQTVAEGIETALHRDLAKASGCDLLQGYYLGKPVSAGQITELLTVQNSILWPIAM